MPRKSKPIQSIGQLVAMSENEDHQANDSEELRRVLRVKRSYSATQVELLAKDLEGRQCSGKEGISEECILLFLAFLDASIPKETATRLFAHLSSCYTCFDEFACNWTAYLAAQE
jgi:hypothetical protein